MVSLPEPRTPVGDLKAKNKKVQSACLYVFGGMDHEGKILGDLWVYDTRKKRWWEPPFTGTPPCARCGHTAAAVGDRYLVVLGGFDSTKQTNMHLLDIRKCPDWMRSLTKVLL
jgi:N-acetylneuraminic acid mutarotase